jgi:septum site-determining protein MinC
MIRGKGGGLEIVISGQPFVEALEDLRARFTAGPDFYRGTQATVIFEAAPSAEELGALGDLLAEAGVEWDGSYAEANVTTLPVRERAAQQIELSDAARSLVADFAGARADLAQRRIRGPRRRPEPAPIPILAPLATPAPEPPSPAVLYHRGTLRGGQSLANVGHVVVVGDVNPGAELVAGGDIVVFGALRGVAHAGAQGETSARVYALSLAPTQLRIATTIAAGFERDGSFGPEEALIGTDGEIAIAPAGHQPPLTPRATAEQT